MPKYSYQFLEHSVSYHTTRYGGNDPFFEFPITVVTIIPHPLPSDLFDKASLNNTCGLCISEFHDL